MSIVSGTDRAEFFLAVEGCFVTELYNSDADSALSIARIRVEPGDTTRWHRLKDTTERYYILSGCGLVEVGDAPAQIVVTGDIVLIPAMERQRISNKGESDLVFLAICNPRFEERNFQLAK